MADEREKAGVERDVARALPTKSFFVDMLVRDIELRDAVLDLIDNCVDGILRTYQRDINAARPYAQFRADIVVGAERFSISDNCGGIPIQVARESAFALGRPRKVAGHSAAATVGMYGVGMKRAIFKFGRNATVRSYNDEPLRVDITPEWLDDPNWSDLTIEHPPAEEIRKGTTEIVVTDLNPSVRAEFGQTEFLTELATEVSKHFALIIDKGFSITIRACEEDDKPAPVPAASTWLLGPPDGAPQAGLAPWIYKGRIGAVEVELYCGFYRKMPSEDEEEQEAWAEASANDSGWTIACNDRVVLWRDRQRATGWGEASVPSWHNQFLGITGFLLLRAEDPDDLPLTTTKRGVDGSSDVYLIAKDAMREATKSFTNFTNKWKAASAERDAVFAAVERIDLAELRRRAWPMRPWHKLDTVSRFAPTLPTPVVKRTDARVSFVAPKGQVVELAAHYFDDATVKPRFVGEEAFRREYDRLPKAAE